MYFDTVCGQTLSEVYGVIGIFLTVYLLFLLLFVCIARYDALCSFIRTSMTEHDAQIIYFVWNPRTSIAYMQEKSEGALYETNHVAPVWRPQGLQTSMIS